MPALRVPFALTKSGENISPMDAKMHRASGVTLVDFVCPDCRMPVIFKEGRGVVGSPVSHFAHKVSPEHVHSCDFARGESETHLLAKLRIKAVVEQRIPVVFVRTCMECGHRKELAFPHHRIAKASLEHHIGRHVRADVALFDGAGELVVVIEVLHTHTVDAEKTRSLNGIRWAEIKAISILEGDDWLLEQDFTRAFDPSCPGCIQRSKVTNVHLYSKRVELRKGVIDRQSNVDTGASANLSKEEKIARLRSELGDFRSISSEIIDAASRVDVREGIRALEASWLRTRKEMVTQGLLIEREGQFFYPDSDKPV